MPYEPSKAEIEALAADMRGADGIFTANSSYTADAAWILSRFVRREDVPQWATVAGKEIESLRAELRGQRCDGSGKLRGTVAGLPSGLGCPGCPACKPTPKSDKPCDIHSVGLHTDNCNRGRTPESVSVLEQHCSDADFETIGKMRDESYAAGYSAGRDDAARLNIQEVVHVTKLHEDTLRALVAALLRASHKWSSDETIAVVNADNLLTHLKETK